MPAGERFSGRSTEIDENPSPGRTPVQPVSRKFEPAGSLRRIGYRIFRPRPSCHRQARYCDLARRKNMKHLITTDDKIIRDYPAMTPPPHCLRAHHGTAPQAAQIAKPREARAKTAAHRIIGVVVKTLILPEGIDLWRNILCAGAEAAEFGDMLICDLKPRQ